MAENTPIRKICEQYDLTQAGLAKCFGIPIRTVEQWCTGKRQPPEYVVGMIQTILEQKNITTPKKPIEYDKHYYKCPACGEDLGVSNDDLYVYDLTPPRRCPNCDQALLWSK